MRSLMICSKCGGKGIVKEGGKWVECSCRLRERVKENYGMFLPAPSLSKVSKDLLDKAGGSFMFEGLVKNQWKSFLLVHLSKLLKLRGDFSVYRTYELVDMYLSNEVDVNLYGFKGSVLVFLHGFSNVPNKRELDILGQVLDMYRDRDLIVYSAVKRDMKLRSVCYNKGLKLLN